MLVVEDGSCRPDAESYASVAVADAYHQARGNPGWTGVARQTGADAVKEAALRKAASYLDGTYRARYVGRKRSGEQALAWPRISAVDTDGWILPIDSVPPAMVRAACEVALRAMGGDIQPDVANSGIVTYYRDKVGPLEEETHYVGGSMRTRFTSVEDALSGIVRGRGTVELVRS